MGSAEVPRRDHVFFLRMARHYSGKGETHQAAVTHRAQKGLASYAATETAVNHTHPKHEL
ncbi:MAG TPA: hypothetical protein VJ692_05225 [Nitrospiraceae bacterium]|nr:hypothetical protein [Nitrospiraceae bacterium]